MLLAAMLFPLFMALAYPASYLSAMLDPAPTHMQLEIIASTDSASSLAQQLGNEGDGRLVVTTAADAETASADVLDLTARAAFDPATGDLYVASAGGLSATSAARQIFGEVAQQTDTTLTVHDLRAPAAADTTGTGFMYILTASIVAGYVTATMLSSIAPTARLRTKLLVQVLMAVVAGVLTTGVTFGLYGVYGDHLVGVGLIAAATFLTASVVQLGFSVLLGQAATLVGISLFVILGVPASGAAISPEMLPGFFRVLHRMLPSGASGELLRRVLYFDGAGIGPWILLLATWALLGAGLLWLGSLRAPRTSRDSVLTEEREHLREHPDGGMLTAYETADGSSAPATHAAAAPDPLGAALPARRRAFEGGQA